MPEMLQQMSGPFETLARMDQDAMMFVAVFSLIFGLLQCFLGYKITKIMYAILGFILGWVLTFLVGGTMMLSASSGSGGAQPILLILIGLVLSILLAFLMFKIYLVGVFISQFFLSFGVFILVLAALTKKADQTTVLLSLALALAVAVISVILVRPVIIICTAWSGGMSVGSALAMLLRLENPIGLVLGIVAAIGGMVVQFMTTKKPAAPAAPPAYGYPPAPPAANPNWQTPPYQPPQQPAYQPVQQPAAPVYQAPQQPVTPAAPEAPAPAAPAPAEAETVMTEAPQAPAEGGWTCSCGRVNYHLFCEDCGKPRPQ